MKHSPPTASFPAHNSRQRACKDELCPPIPLLTGMSQPVIINELSCDGRVTVQPGYCSGAAENVEQVPQSSGRRQRGPAERGHQERPQHFRWRWDDSHPPGSLPRVPGSSGSHLQEGVSSASLHCSRPQNYSSCLVFLRPQWPPAQKAENHSNSFKALPRIVSLVTVVWVQSLQGGLSCFLRQGVRSSSGVSEITPASTGAQRVLHRALRGAGPWHLSFPPWRRLQQPLRMSWDRIHREIPHFKQFQQKNISHLLPKCS